MKNKGYGFSIKSKGLIPIPIWVKNEDVVNYLKGYERNVM